MAKTKGKSELQKLERKMAQIESGKWTETPEAIKKLKARIAELKTV